MLVLQQGGGELNYLMCLPYGSPSMIPIFKSSCTMGACLREPKPPSQPKPPPNPILQHSQSCQRPLHESHLYREPSASQAR
jgi:hypothetical protein